MPADVRACWNDGGRQEIPVDESPPIDPEPDGIEPVPETETSGGDRGDGTLFGGGGGREPRRPARSRPVRARPAPDDVPRGVAQSGAGPDRLGRHAVVAPDADVPPPWAAADRVLITPATLDQPGAVLDRLRAAGHERQRLVIEVAADLDRPPALATDAPPYELGARFAFELDELYHLVWSNAVDLRSPEPAWVVLDRAVAAGATALPPGATGDIELPTGEAVWLDGGPLRHTEPIDGVPVLHAVAVEHGSFAVPGPNTSGAELAADQLAAVTHAGGAARIVAPAGSGKTRVLTERARHLLGTWNLPASAVVLVAFNKRAQEEMTERTRDLPGLQIRTLNSLALAIVNGTPPFRAASRSWRTIDELEVRRIIGELVGFPRRRNSDPVAPWIEALSLIRLGLVDPVEAEARYGGDVDGLAGVWPRYRDALDRQRVVDFDDQVHRALLVLLTDPAARRDAQRACRVMLVDEFQDLTPAHLLMIRLLAAPGGAVFGVGDDDQTIYGYNGADPAWLIDFGELFPGAGDHPLEVNYRCPAGIVESVDRLLRHNRRRVPKLIRAESADRGGWTVDGAVDAVASTSAAVAGTIDSGAAPADIAVLTRVNALLAPVQVALTTAGVPIAGGVGREFVDRTSVRTVLAWLRLASASGPFEADDLREALRRPSRSFHPRITDWVCEQRDVVDLIRLAGRLNNERDAERVKEFAADVQTMQQRAASGAPTSDLVFTLVDEIGLAGSVATLDATRRGMNRSAQGDDLTAVQHLAALHDDAGTFERWLRGRLSVERSAEGVVLATVHRVKGQEWAHVVVHFADAEQYPHRLADDVEEERRLFHVALTRAGRHATIVTGSRPSPFVAELTTEPTADRVVSAHVAQRAPAAKQGGRSGADPVADLDPDAAARFEALKVLRNELRDGKPAYVVFDNKTLAAIARTAPTTRQELARISGVGPAKLDRYGESVIELITGLTR